MVLNGYYLFSINFIGDLNARNDIKMGVGGTMGQNIKKMCTRKKVLPINSVIKTD